MNRVLNFVNSALRPILLVTTVASFIARPLPIYAYPIFAQEAYDTPREPTGRIVCANCHLAQKPVALEMPQSILPSQIFSIEAEIPVDLNVSLTGGQKTIPNVGAVLIVPDGFKLASRDQLSEADKKATKGPSRISIVFAVHASFKNSQYC